MISWSWKRNFCDRIPEKEFVNAFWEDIEGSEWKVFLTVERGELGKKKLNDHFTFLGYRNYNCWSQHTRARNIQGQEDQVWGPECLGNYWPKTLESSENEGHSTECRSRRAEPWPQQQTLQSWREFLVFCLFHIINTCCIFSLPSSSHVLMGRSSNCPF